MSAVRRLPVVLLRSLEGWVLFTLVLPAVSFGQGVSLEWIARYGGPSNVIDQANALAVDAAGNSYVTGSGDRNGPLLGGDIVTVKLNAAGQTEWVARYGNPGQNADAGTAITVDASGQVYVTGYSYANAPDIRSQDFVTIKYSPTGMQLWAARFSGPTNAAPLANSMDYPRAIAVDNAGQVYVTGNTMDSGGNARDYLTVKYDGKGALLWSAIYDSADHDNDSATALAVNGAGEVFVAGFAGAVKYDASGNQMWFRPGAFAAVALDAQGNPIFAGPSFLEGEDPDETPDLRVIKYSTAGNYLWHFDYDGPAGEADSATALKVDAMGNIHVTGSSETGCTWIEDSDGVEEKVCDLTIVTLSLNAGGTLQWLARYGDSSAPIHFPVAFELDSAGNSYVVASEGPWSRTVTIKYDTAGTRRWAIAYSDPAHGWDSPAGTGVSAIGEVLVAGSSHWSTGGSSDYFVLKYSQPLTPGQPEILVPPTNQVIAIGSNVSFTVVATGLSPLSYQWFREGEVILGETGSTLSLTNVSHYGETEYSVQVSNQFGVVTSADARLTVRNRVQFYGDVVEVRTVVGGTVTLEMAAYGTPPISLQWLHNGEEIPDATNALLRLANIQPGQSGTYALRAVDAVSSGVSPASHVIVSALAEQCWEARPPGDVSRRFQSGGVIASDSAGNVFVAASHLGVVKFGPDGNVVWNTPYPGEVGGIVLDALGNIIVTGFETDDPSFDFVTVKYSPTGAVLWTRLYDGEAKDDDRATAVKVDSANNIIITGWATSSNGQDYVTIKYSPAGDTLWRAVHDSPDHRQDFPYALAIDAADNIYVTGQSSDAGTRMWDATTVKYSPNGVAQWVAFYRSSQTNSVASDIAIDANGDVYVSGWTWEPDHRNDAFVLKLNASGQTLWARTYNGPANRDDSFGHLSLDGQGNVVAAGTSSRAVNYVNDALVVKFAPDGQQLWASRYIGSDGYAAVQDLALDTQGNAYVLAHTGVNGLIALTTFKLDPQGNRRWEAPYVDNVHTWPGAITVNSEGDVLVCGGSDRGATAWNRSRLLALKYCQAEPAGAPTILQKPADVTVQAGQDAAFNVTASGEGTLRYRWWNSSGVMVGSSEPVLALPQVEPIQAGDYTVEVCNDQGCAVSPVARLTVEASALQLHSPWITEDNFGFEFVGPETFPFVVETSTNLQHWTAISTNQGVIGPIPFSFPRTHESARFFRARRVQ